MAIFFFPFSTCSQSFTKTRRKKTLKGRFTLAGEVGQNRYKEVEQTIKIVPISQCSEMYMHGESSQCCAVTGEF